MIYDQLQLSAAGDRHVLASLGDDASLEANFLALGFATALDNSGMNAITDIIPSYNSVLIQYDFFRISYAALCRALVEVKESLPPVGDIEIPSRIVTIPVLYLDPWTKECIDDYCSKVTVREYDPEFVARVNGLGGVEELVARHSGCEQWVVTVSSFPGLPILRPLDPRCALVSPKYNPPRMWTPVGSIGVGGTSTSIYTIQSPGGYNLIGRTPVPVWDPAQRLPAFRNGAILLRAADRVRFAPISRDEYDRLEALVREARYEYVIEPGVFSVKEYEQGLAIAALQQGRGGEDGV
jgi:urea carboxylase